MSGIEGGMEVCLITPPNLSPSRASCVIYPNTRTFWDNAVIKAPADGDPCPGWRIGGGGHKLKHLL